MGRRRKISGLEVSHMEDKAVGKPKNSETVHMCDAEAGNICGAKDREELLRKLRFRIQQEMEISPSEPKADTGTDRETSPEINPEPALNTGSKCVPEPDRDTVSDLLWNVLSQYQKEPFYTVKGLEFTYYIKGNELFVDRKNKSITRASVDLALQKAMELNLIVSGPKKLTSFGASYLYPIFLKLGILQPKNQTS